MTYHGIGIILRRQDAHEWDRLYTIYTREHGKLLLVGKGTRRPRAKLASHLEPFCEVELSCARGRQIDRVTYARALRTNGVFSVSHEVLAVASWCCECVDVLTKSSDPDPALYDLLGQTLGAIALAAPSVSRPASLIPPFTLRLLAILGYTPQLERCIACRGALPRGKVIGLPERGGVACMRCAEGRLLLAPDDRRGIARALATFTPEEQGTVVEAYANGLLLAHLPYPMRTPLTVLAGGSTVAAS